MAKVKGGVALDLQFLPRGDGLFVTFSVGSKEHKQWGRVFQAFKERIPLGYRTVLAKEPQWLWEVGPLSAPYDEDNIELALSEIFENFASALACWRESPTLPGMEFVKGGEDECAIPKS